MHLQLELLKKLKNYKAIRNKRKSGAEIRPDSIDLRLSLTTNKTSGFTILFVPVIFIWPSVELLVLKGIDEGNKCGEI